MRPPSARILLGATLGALAVGTTAARGEDWPQFRKDPGRTGASGDRTRFPVTDVWNWSTRGATGDTPTYECAIAAGRVYFLALEAKQRYLVCADAKTAMPLWRQPLMSTMLHVRGVPAVSGDGKVYVYDEFPGKPPPSLFNRDKAGIRTQLLAASPEEIGGFVVRTFHPSTGYPLATLPLRFLEMQDDLPEVVLFDERVGAPPDILQPSGRPVLEHDLVTLGAPLLLGSELHAFTNLDIYVRWSPNTLLSATRIRHVGTNTPAEFWGFPPVLTASGILAANDQADFRFYGVFGGANFHLWHNDLPYTFGLPAAADNDIFVGLGKLGATSALTCISSASGQPRWIYAPAGLKTPRRMPGSQKVGTYASRVVTVPKRRQGSGGLPPGTVGAASPSGDLGKSSGDLRTRMEALLRDGFRVITRPAVNVAGTVTSDVPPGHESSGGIVLMEKAVYGEVDGAIVGLDRASGRPIWKQPLPGNAYVQSLVGSPQHIIASYTLPVTLRARTALRGMPERREGRQRSREQIPYWDRAIRKAGSRHFVVAYRASDGKQVWRQELLQPGTFALADGLIFFANGDLTAYGPAERTYLVAEDGDDPQAYVTPRETEKEPQETPTDLPVAAAPTDTERPASPASGERESKPLPAAARADVSILRLTYDTPLEAQLAQVRDRVKRLEPQRIPLILQLDWLDPQRAAVRGFAPDTLAPPPAEFVARCVRLAQVGTPLYFDLAPEVNLYLRRYPERTRAVTELLAPAAAAVRRASPGCQIVFTFNTEVLLETYGKGMVHPYGKLPKGDPQTEPARLISLARLADAVGLSTRPYAGFRNAGVLPPDYLLRARQRFAPMPLLVTRIVIDADVRGAVVRGERAEFARRMLQACYWLNARVVAQAELTGYPELAVGEDGGAKDPIRQMAVKWQGVVAWPRVARLTATPPRHLPEALDPEGPRDTGQ